MRRPGIALAALCLCSALLMACGGDGDGDDDETPNQGVTITSAATPAATQPPDSATGGQTGSQTGASSEPTAPASGSPEATGPNGAAGSGENDLDVCTLISQEEVEAVIGEPAGTPEFVPADEAFTAAMDLAGGDCVFRAEDITPEIGVTVLRWGDAATAEESFELGLQPESELDGPGDRAASTQPIGDLAVLSGRYELLIDIYFVSEDAEAELGMATEIAELVVSRLP